MRGRPAEPLVATQLNSLSASTAPTLAPLDHSQIQMRKLNIYLDEKTALSLTFPHALARAT